MEGALVFWKYRTLFSLILCTLVLFKVHLTHAAPTSQQNNEAVPLSKIYPRGSHWAVGHLMGKKSIEEYPYAYDGGDRVSAAIYSEGDKAMWGSQQWSEALQNLLRMLDLSNSRNTQPMREATLYNKKLWDTEDNSSLKEMLAYLYQMMSIKENSSS
ncbi:gastrin-releasing peptide isoform 1-T2 [Rhinophrynus dorsalis]